MIEKYYQKIKSILGLSLRLAITEFKLRNEGSFLGVFWYLLNPILTFILLFLIFSERLGGNISYYPLYLMLGIIMFNFFQASTIESAKTILSSNKWIIKSINFPRESLVLSIILKTLFSHFFEILLFSVFLMFFKISPIGILYYPFVLIFYCLFLFGLSLILASLTVYFVDMENIWDFGTKIIYFLTPIFYAIEGQTRLFYLNLLNPLYYFITTARDLVIYNELPDFWLILGLISYSIIFFAAGLIIFKKLKVKISEFI